MIGVYKIGQHYYLNGTDKNGGLHEKNLIINKLRLHTKEIVLDLNLVFANNTHSNNFDSSLILKSLDKIVFISGLRTEAEDERLAQYLTSNKSLKEVIYVHTDFDTTSEEEEKHDKVKKLCSKVLTQIPGKEYSYLPELFYENEKLVKKEHDKRHYTVFGGTEAGREKEFMKYIFKNEEKELRDKVVLFGKYTKEGKLIDSRVPYNEFIKEFSKYKYTINCIDKICIDSGWVTPRFIEALSNKVLPFIDVKYDLAGHFLDNAHRNLLEVNSYEEMQEKISLYEDSAEDSKVKKELNECVLNLKEKVNRRHLNFIKIVKGEKVCL